MRKIIKQWALFIILCVEIAYLIICELRATSIIRGYFDPKNLEFIAFISPLLLVFWMISNIDSRKKLWVLYYIISIIIQIVLYIVHRFGIYIIMNIPRDGLGDAYHLVAFIASFIILSIGWIVVMIVKNIQLKNK